MVSSLTLRNEAMARAKQTSQIMQMSIAQWEKAFPDEMLDRQVSGCPALAGRRHMPALRL